MGALFELLAQVRWEGGQVGGECGGGRGSARNPVALLVPRLHAALRVGLDPRLRSGYQFLDGGHDLVDQSDLLGLDRSSLLTLQQYLHERVLQTEHPYRAHDSATAGQQAEGHLGEADLDALHVRGDAVVGGEGDFESAAECGTVDCGDDGLAEGFEATQIRLDRDAVVVDFLGVLGPELDHVLQVAAGEEGLLAGRDDDARDGVLLLDEAVDGRLHRGDVGVVHGVRALVGIVDGEHDDAVGVLLPVDDVLLAHCFKSPVDPGVRRAQ